MKLKTLEKNLISELDDEMDELMDDSYWEERMEEIAYSNIPLYNQDIWRLFGNDWNILLQYKDDADDMTDFRKFDIESYLKTMIYVYLVNEVAWPWAKKSRLG